MNKSSLTQAHRSIYTHLHTRSILKKYIIYKMEPKTWLQDIDLTVSVVYDLYLHAWTNYMQADILSVGLSVLVRRVLCWDWD